MHCQVKQAELGKEPLLLQIDELHGKIQEEKIRTNDALIENKITEGKIKKIGEKHLEATREIRAQVETKELEIQELNKNIAEKKARIKERNTSIRKLQAEIDNNAFKLEVNAQKQKIQDLILEVEGLRLENQKFEKSAALHAERASELETQISALTVHTESLQAQLKDAQNEAKTARKEQSVAHAETTQKLDDMNIATLRAKAQFGKAEKEAIKNANAKVLEFNKQNKELKTELEKVTLTHNNCSYVEKKLEDRVEQLEHVVDTVAEVTKSREFVRGMAVKKLKDMIPSLGISIGTIEVKTSEGEKIVTKDKVVVVMIQQDSEGYALGIRENDELLQVNDKKIYTTQDYYNCCGKMVPGDKVAVLCARGKRVISGENSDTCTADGSIASFGSAACYLLSIGAQNYSAEEVRAVFRLSRYNEADYTLLSKSILN